MNPFKLTLDNKRYHTLNFFLKNYFNAKVVKVPLSLGYTCPNRDGSRGVGGCIFCSGGGGGSEISTTDLRAEFDCNYKKLKSKWPAAKAIGFFQNFTNTYLPVDMLRTAFEKTLSFPNLVGISIATRPDCLPDGILDLLSEYSRQTFLTVELGLQTTHDHTSNFIGRGHSYGEFLLGYNALIKRGIRVCIHLINGLPFETSEMMIETARRVSLLRPHSIKFHMLHISDGTRLADYYRETPFPLLSREQYVSILADQLELIDPECVVERISGDPIKNELIAPEWVCNKLWLRNTLDKEFEKRDSFQGFRFNI